MKKLFRFKYEPCNGTCYAWDRVFYEELKKLEVEARVSLVNTVTAAHDKLCDNPDYYFGLDRCEKTGLFIGHFRQPTGLDLFTGLTLPEAILEMCEFILKTDIPKILGECNFGDSGNENLAEVILRACS